MVDTPSGETVIPGDTQTTVQTTATPTVKAADPAEVERLQREADTKEQRIRQLENEAEVRKKADEEARQKQLEEEQKFKELYESEKEQRETLVREREEADRNTQLTTAQNELFSKYSADVIELANTTGLKLTDDTEDAKTQLTSKLDAIAKKVVTTPRVAANNQGVSDTSEPERAHLLKGMKFGDNNSTNKIISGIPAIQEMRRQAGVGE